MMNLPSVLEIAKDLALARAGRGHPLYLVHALTARCNARCGFCAWNPDFYDPMQQLSTEEIKRLYSDARAAGFIGLSIWGGEPLLFTDFEEVVRHARELGHATHMVTNGFLLDRKLDAVATYVDRVCISLDHPSAVHDELRGIKGLYERIVSSARALKRRAPDKATTPHWRSPSTASPRFKTCTPRWRTWPIRSGAINAACNHTRPMCCAARKMNDRDWRMNSTMKRCRRSSRWINGCS